MIKLCQLEVVGTRSCWLNGQIFLSQSILGLLLMSFNVSTVTFMGIIIFFFSPMLIFSKLGRDDGECNQQTPLKAYMRQGKAGSSAQALI